MAVKRRYKLTKLNTVLKDWNITVGGQAHGDGVNGLCCCYGFACALSTYRVDQLHHAERKVPEVGTLVTRDCWLRIAKCVNFIINCTTCIATFTNVKQYIQRYYI